MENWEKIPGYEGFMASNLGNIKTLKRAINYGNRICLRQERILKPHKSKVGYYTVAPFQKTTLVHRLITLTFLGERPINSVIDHIDGDYLNNNINNLRYVTQKENVHNAMRLGKTLNGESCSWSKLTIKQVLEIREDKRIHKLIAKDYNICRQSVGEIKNRLIWKYI